MIHTIIAVVVSSDINIDTASICLRVLLVNIFPSARWPEIQGRRKRTHSGFASLALASACEVGSVPKGGRGGSGTAQMLMAGKHRGVMDAGSGNIGYETEPGDKERSRLHDTRKRQEGYEREAEVSGEEGKGEKRMKVGSRKAKGEMGAEEFGIVSHKSLFLAAT